VTGFGSFDNSTCKRVLGLLEPGGLRLGEIVIKSCSSQASSEQWKWAVAMVEALLKSRLVRNTDTAKLTNIVIAGFGDRRDLVRKVRRSVATPAIPLPTPGCHLPCNLHIAYMLYKCEFLKQN